MKLFWILLRRNAILYWQYTRIRAASILLSTLIILSFLAYFRGSDFKTNLYGVVQRGGIFDLPIVWLFLVLSPIMIVGDSINLLLRKNYPLVSYVPLRAYLGTLQILTTITTCLTWCSWFIISGGWHTPEFSATVLIIVTALTWSYSITQVFVSPVIAELIYLGILVACAAINGFPLLSQLMFSRYSPSELTQTIVELLVLLAGISVLTYQLRRLDF